MNARLIKETRDLLPIFAGTLALIVVPQLLWPPAGYGYFALGVACIVMAGSSFGSEFQHRTLTLLLSQPIARSVLWREKMLVLGAGVLASLAVLVGCLAFSHAVIDQPEWPALVLIPLCAFCGAPYWTLLLRQGIAGMVFAVAAPCGILAVYALVVEQLGEINRAAMVSAIQILLLIYCVVVYWLGYAKFKRLEAVDGPSRDLSLPNGLEAVFVRPLTRISARFHSPFATLLKKEFRMQQTSFLLAGLFVLIAVAGVCLIRHHHGWAAGMVVVDYATYVVILPLIAGATSLGEEKGWAIAEWHLTLPPSALKQWSAKMLAALSTSVALGLLLPIAMFLAGQALFSLPGPGASRPPAPEILCWKLGYLLGYLLVTSVAVYAASFSNGTLRAILAAFGIIVAGCGACYLVGTEAVKIIEPGRRLGILIDLPSLILKPHRLEILIYSPFVTEALRALIPMFLAGGLFFILCVVQWFAWSNFRRYVPSARRIVVQFLLIFFAVGLIALAALATSLAIFAKLSP